MGQIFSQCTKHIFHNQKLKQVKKLPQEQSNFTVSNEEILKNHPGYIGNKEALYFPYNNIYGDKGWGCAWRAIQMVLSSYKNKQTFLDLFYKYSSKQFLLQIVKSHNLYSQPVIKQLNQSSFAPIQASGNWAEPFICKLVCEQKNIRSRLFLLNGYPKTNAPQSVFLETLSFDRFTKIVKQAIVHSPVMIDDGLLALTILAYKEISQTQHGFILGDPHICSNRSNKQVGVYQIVCDHNGRQIRNFVKPQTLKESYVQTLQQAYFLNKNWMVLVTQGWKLQN